jgi:histidinol-phosphate aminotransferase
MSLRLKPHVAALPLLRPVAVPPGVQLVANLSCNENPLGPSPSAMSALLRALEMAHRYPDPTCSALKAALAAKWDVNSTNVALANGIDEWGLLLFLVLVEPGGEAVMAQVSFLSYLLRAKLLGVHLTQVPLKDYTHDLEAMAEAITDRTRLVLICNPNNPTGTVVSAAAMEAFLERVPEQVAVVLDEAYYEYAVGPDYPRSVDYLRAGQRNLIVLRSFSKAYGLAGLRVGYMLADEKVIDHMERARLPYSVNCMAQAAALAALDDDEHLQRSREANEAAKAFFYRELVALGLHPVRTHANFMAIDVRRPGTEVSELLSERGFVTTPLEIWGMPNHVRFSFGTPAQNRAFLTALRGVTN